MPIPLAPQPVNKCHITYMASAAPTVSRASHAQGTQDHIKFTAYFETACLPHPPLFIKNIIIIKVRSDLGIASPGRFAWAWGGVLVGPSSPSLSEDSSLAPRCPGSNGSSSSLASSPQLTTRLLVHLASSSQWTTRLLVHLASSPQWTTRLLVHLASSPQWTTRLLVHL